jgi:hypothetical protein
VECATDNTTRTVANVKSYFNKAGGSLVPTGSLEFMFSHKAVFEFEKKEGMDIEELELALIDEGLEEIEEVEGIFMLMPIIPVWRFIPCPRKSEHRCAKGCFKTFLMSRLNSLKNNWRISRKCSINWTTTTMFRLFIPILRKILCIYLK